MIVKPKRPGIKLRDPRTMRHVPAAGLRFSEQDHDAVRHWERQALAGDAVIEPDPVPAPKATAIVPAPDSEEG